MPEWMCRICGNVLRDRARPPSYCARCGLGKFMNLEAVQDIPPTLPVSESSPEVILAEGTPLAAATPELRVVPLIPATEGAPAIGPRRGSNGARSRQPAKRVQPREPLEVRFARSAPLDPVDISVSGLLVEYVRPFTPGSVCDVELWRSDMGLRLRAEVVRSIVSGGGKGSLGGIRYQTAVHFLKTPRGIYTLVPELSEEA